MGKVLLISFGVILAVSGLFSMSSGRPRIEINTISCKLDGGYQFIEGKITNAGKNPSDLMFIKATFFRNGQIVRSAVQPYITTIEPGATAPYEFVTTLKSPIDKCLVEFATPSGKLINSTSVDKLTR